VTLPEIYSLAVWHHQAGRLREADSLYRQVLAQQPDHAGALEMLGVLAHQIGRQSAAVELLQRSVAIDPANADAQNNLGVALAAAGRWDEAIAAYRQALMARPDHARAHNNLGSALREIGRLDEAIDAYRVATTLRRDYVEAHDNLGHALREQGLLDDAIAAYKQALALSPQSPDILNSLGAALQEKGELDEAVATLHRALELRADFAEAHYNLAVTCQDQGRLDEAVDSYQRAIALRPEYVDAHKNLGNALRQKGNLDAAILAYERALAVRPDSAESRWNLGLALLTKGDFARGWDAYEARRQVKQFGGERQFAQAAWDGRPLSGRRILLYAEQGLGDTIQFIRYCPLVSGRGGRVIVQCRGELWRLLVAQCGIDQLVCDGDPLPSFDVQCPLPSVPRIFGTTLQTIPATTPYLFADAALSELWRTKMQPGEARLRIGLNWAGNPIPWSNRIRSLDLQDLAPLGRLSGPRFYSMQKGEASAQTRTPPCGLQLLDLGKQIGDLADTAAVMANLDLIITCDTSVAHLAGALGRPVWVLLPFAADWRWLLDRTDSPWYPTMRLFRQTRAGDWRDPVEQVARRLTEGSTA